jgi:hypothetical protein
MAELTDYTGLITSEHNQRPKFMAVVAALAQPMVDLMSVLGSMPARFDLDVAVGVQLDDVGRWVGISRIIRTPLTNVYFSLDIDGIGFDQGIWKGPFDPDTGLTTLDDDTYRAVIRAKIGANHWDGTMEGSVAILNSIFSPAGELEPTLVHADAEPFGVGDGSRFQYQILYQGQPVYKVDSATLLRNDWQGNQKLYPTPRTNLIASSSNFAVGSWAKVGVTAEQSVALAPDGSMTATKLVENTATSTHPLRRSITFSPATPYTMSWMLKRGERSACTLVIADGGGSAHYHLNLITGEVQPGSVTLASSVTLTPLADDWYRLSISFTSSSAPSGSYVDVRLSNVWPITSPFGQSYTGDGVSGLYIWETQFESGLTPTSQIPTTTTAVTLTDYTLSPTGIVELGQTPVSGATLTWTGDGYTYPSGTYVFIQDNQDMTMTIGIAGKMPSAVFLALLEGGYIPLKPEGVRVNFTVVTTVEGSPLFGFDVNNPYAAGFDVGAWGRLL